MTAALVVPDRSLQQRHAALQLANDTRSHRARMKRDLSAGRVDVLQLLSDPPAFIEKMSVFDLLLAVPRYGRVKTRKVLRQHDVSLTKTLGGLSARQRVVLVDALRAARVRRERVAARPSSQARRAGEALEGIER